MVDSAYTSRPQVPAATRKALERGFFHAGSRILDFGGGKYDVATKYLAEQSITNLVYDTQLSQEHNDAVIEEVKTKGIDGATLNNVLNVVSQEIGEAVLAQLASLVGDSRAPVVISVYEGDRSGTVKPGIAQRNIKAEAYRTMIEAAFPTRIAKRSGNIYWLRPGPQNEPR
jgi:hypothetical protein